MPIAYNFGSDKIPRGYRVDIFGGVSVPAAGARITIGSDGRPDATENPNAVHMGRTTEGAELSAGGDLTPLKTDDFAAPYDYARSDAEMMSIKANIKAVLDFVVRALLTNHGTRTTGTGYDQITYGGKVGPITAAGFVAVVQMPETSPAKFYVFHIYAGVNRAAYTARFRREGDPTNTPINIEGVNIVTRAAGDQLGNEWHQV